MKTLTFGLASQAQAKNCLIRLADANCANKSSNTVVINSYNSCMMHSRYRVLTSLVVRSATYTLLHLFHNALDHNDNSALPGHSTRTIACAD